MKQRILPLDGLRTIAALGVLWIHIWTFYGNPALKIAGADFYKLIAVLGNGVDFFFVISGFCMYLMMNKNLSLDSYAGFLWKRFKRIAPAYYTAVLVYAMIIKWNDPSFQFLYQVSFHLLFLNNVVTGNTISGPFWSLGTEWHFYMLLPLLIRVTEKISLIRTVIIFSIMAILLFCFVNLGYLPFDFWEKQILVRFPEFGIGILAAYFFIRSSALPSLFRGAKGILFGLLILYAGRIIRTEEILQHAGSIGFLLKSVADTVMCSGFAIIMYQVITERSLLSSFLGSAVMTYLGRISFSIYLWHSLSILLLENLLKKLSFGTGNAPVGFILCGILSVVMAHISYTYLEAFYFKKRLLPACDKLNTDTV